MDLKLQELMNMPLDKIEEFLDGRKFIISISGLDNMGKSTQANMLSEKYPSIFSKPIHINQSPSFPTMKGKDLSHWWFNPDNVEEFCHTMYKSLAERKEAALKSDSPIVILDKGIDFYDVRIKATLLTLGVSQDRVAEMITNTKKELGLFNSYEDLKVIITQPKDNQRSNVREEEKNDNEDTYMKYLGLNVELLNDKLENEKVFAPVEFIEGDIETIHSNILDEIIENIDMKTQRKKVEQLTAQAKEHFGDNLKMLILAGSAGKGKFINGWSDIDMYYFFDKMDYQKLAEYSNKLSDFGVHVGPTYYTTKDLENLNVDARTVHVLLELEKGKDKILINDGVEIPNVSIDYAKKVDKGDIPDTLNRLKRELLHQNTNPNKDNTRDKIDDSANAKMPYDTAKIIKNLSLLHKLLLKSADDPIIPDGYLDTFESFGQIYGQKLLEKQQEYISNNDAENIMHCQNLYDTIKSIDIVEVIENRATYDTCMQMHDYGMAVLQTLDEVGYENDMEDKICQNDTVAEQ